MRSSGSSTPSLGAGGASSSPTSCGTSGGGPWRWSPSRRQAQWTDRARGCWCSRRASAGRATRGAAPCWSRRATSCAGPAWRRQSWASAARPRPRSWRASGSRSPTSSRTSSSLPPPAPHAWPPSGARGAGRDRRCSSTCTPAAGACRRGSPSCWRAARAGGRTRRRRRSWRPCWPRAPGATASCTARPPPERGCWRRRASRGAPAARRTPCASTIACRASSMRRCAPRGPRCTWCAPGATASAARGSRPRRGWATVPSGSGGSGARRAARARTSVGCSRSPSTAPSSGASPPSSAPRPGSPRPTSSRRSTPGMPPGCCACSASRTACRRRGPQSRTTRRWRGRCRTRASSSSQAFTLAGRFTARTWTR
mmetsp:Transcript_12631/g.33512  ORF Transcript_12631/g.33512 Transcript_12631/m.33512 type:complete len:369 (+) Transcript_12631:770-1876(+)